MRFTKGVLRSFVEAAKKHSKIQKVGDEGSSVSFILNGLDEAGFVNNIEALGRGTQGVNRRVILPPVNPYQLASSIQDKVLCERDHTSSLRIISSMIEYTRYRMYEGNHSLYQTWFCHILG